MPLFLRKLIQNVMALKCTLLRRNFTQPYTDFLLEEGDVCSLTNHSKHTRLTYASNKFVTWKDSECKQGINRQDRQTRDNPKGATLVKNLDNLLRPIRIQN